MSEAEYPSARALLDKYGFRAKKSWGQNFLIDERVYQKIVDAATADEGLWVTEIGAGLGTLTARLAARAPHVVAVERDRDMVQVLRTELATYDRIEIAEANALTYDYIETAQRAGGKMAVVGNLPYQIASPILFRLLDARAGLSRIVVMLQREMVDRILAQPGTGEYGALTAMVGFYGKPRLVCKAGRSAFLPQPRVDSSVVQVIPHAVQSDVDEKAYSEVVHAAFNQRRKTLRNSLRAVSEVERVDAALAETKIDGERRGETLSVAEFEALARAWVKAK